MKGFPGETARRLADERDREWLASGYLTVRKAAERARRPKGTVNQWIQSGRIKASEIRRTTRLLYVSIKAIDRIAKETNGAPP